MLKEGLTVTRAPRPPLQALTSTSCGAGRTLRSCGSWPSHPQRRSCPSAAGRSLVSGASAALVPLAAATAQGLVAEGSLTFLGLRPRDGAAVFAGECVERVDALAAGGAAGQARLLPGRAAYAAKC